MHMKLTSTTAVLCAGFLVSACANVGTPVSGVTPKASVHDGKSAQASCRSLSRDLRRLEGQNKVASPEYDRLIDLYVRKDCDAR